MSFLAHHNTNTNKDDCGKKIDTKQQRQNTRHTCPMATRAVVPCGLPYAWRIPVCHPTEHNRQQRDATVTETEVTGAGGRCSFNKRTDKKRRPFLSTTTGSKQWSRVHSKADPLPSDCCLTKAESAVATVRHRPKMLLFGSLIRGETRELAKQNCVCSTEPNVKKSHECDPSASGGRLGQWTRGRNNV